MYYNKNSSKSNCDKVRNIWSYFHHNLFKPNEVRVCSRDSVVGTVITSQAVRFDLRIVQPALYPS
jgi:hypothetical protein